MSKDKKRLKAQSQSDLIMEFYKKNPNRDISHPEIVDWVTKEYKKRTSRVFRDPDRAIRKLHEQGLLIKVKKGTYRYVPSKAIQRTTQDFTVSQKKKIFKRDGYRCVICGLGIKDGVELHADHIKPKKSGGRATITNGQTLCSRHNMMKKTMGQTETGKKMFIRLYEIAKREKNKEIRDFCADILQIYEDYKINGHIKWKK